MAKEFIYRIFMLILTVMLTLTLFILFVGVPNTSEGILSDFEDTTHYYAHIYSGYKDGLGKGLITTFTETSYIATGGYGINSRSIQAWETCQAESTVGETGDMGGTHYTLNTHNPNELLAP